MSPLDNPGAVARLLDTLRAAGAAGHVRKRLPGRSPAQLRDHLRRPGPRPVLAVPACFDVCQPLTTRLGSSGHGFSFDLVEHGPDTGHRLTYSARIGTAGGLDDIARGDTLQDLEQPGRFRRERLDRISRRRLAHGLSRQVSADLPNRLGLVEVLLRKLSNRCGAVPRSCSTMSWSPFFIGCVPQSSPTWASGY